MKKTISKQILMEELSRGIFLQVYNLECDVLDEDKFLFVSPMVFVFAILQPILDRMAEEIIKREQSNKNQDLRS